MNEGFLTSWETNLSNSFPSLQNLTAEPFLRQKQTHTTSAWFPSSPARSVCIAVLGCSRSHPQKHCVEIGNLSYATELFMIQISYFISPFHSDTLTGIQETSSQSNKPCASKFRTHRGSSPHLGIRTTEETHLHLLTCKVFHSSNIYWTPALFRAVCYLLGI